MTLARSLNPVAVAHIEVLGQERGRGIRVVGRDAASSCEIALDQFDPFWAT